MNRNSILCILTLAVLIVTSLVCPISANAQTICGRCNGSGKQSVWQATSCSNCLGKGCEVCNNQGYTLVTSITCTLCNGTGKLEEYFDVTYYANDGTDNAIKSRQSEIEPLIISECSFIRPNLVFKGWATTQNGEVIYQPGDSCTITSDIVFYAIWKADDNNVAVTSKEMCHNCNGQGYFKKEKVCITCNGTHYIDTESECTKCSGTGVIMTTSYQKCTRCYGGHIGIIDPNCYICNGTGYLYTNLGQTCTKCSGKGRIPDTRICPNCYEGKIYTKIKCDSCSGLGYIEIIKPIEPPTTTVSTTTTPPTTTATTTTPPTTTVSTTTTETKGDLSGDGTIDFLDLVGLSKLLLPDAKVSNEQLSLADLNDNGKLDFLDLVLLSKELLKNTNK